MMEKEKRENKRFALRFSITYERLLSDGSYSAPVASVLHDFGSRGLSFYSQENVGLSSEVRIKLYLFSKDKISIGGKVVRIELSNQPDAKYLMAVQIENLKEGERLSINSFLNKINIHNLLDNIDLKDITDIHFVAGYPPVVKRVGRLTMESGERLEENALRSILLSMLDEDRYKRFMLDRELNFIFTYREGKRFRVNFHFQQNKIEAVFRLIPTQVGFPTQMGLPLIVEKLLENDKGLILITGSTGSGKTTTLASMVEFLNNKRAGIVVSIEQPIEYLHTNKKCIIKQREVGKDTLSFSNAAKNALRQNPDILVIGEILDVETMEVAITAAESGTLVLSSIHSSDSSQALDRVVSFFPADSQKHILKRLSLILKGLVSQELIPRIDKKGLAVAAEVLVENIALKRIIREGNWLHIPATIETGKNVGMQSMQESLNRLHLRGWIDKDYFKETDKK